MDATHLNLIEMRKSYYWNNTAVELHTGRVFLVLEPEVTIGHIAFTLHIGNLREREIEEMMI